MIDNIFRLKRYLKGICSHKEVPKSELLESNESLKDFAKLWLEHKNDIMAMMAILEYEYISESSYTEEQIATVKVMMAKYIKFLKECAVEWQEFERQQRKQLDH